MFVTLCHNGFQPLKEIMMEIPYKAEFVYVLGYLWFTPLSCSLHHRDLKEA